MNVGNSYKQLIEYLKTGPIYTATVLEGAAAGEKRFWRPEASGKVQQQTGKVRVDGETMYVELLSENPSLVICGGGHISLELAGLADYLEYSYIVLDDRKEFCNYDRFPHAAECLCQPFAEALTKLKPQTAKPYYIIVTRGHMADVECLELILNRSYGYVGMIGSKTKVARAMDLLLQKGYDRKQLGQVHAPIGLNIGGQTPKEIAVSIIAQIIQIRNQEQSSGCLEAELAARLDEGSGEVMVTIIDKQGSAPRGTGSRMLVGKDGILCGTVGGGVVEYEAVKKALEMAAQPKSGSPVEVVAYQVNNESAAALGMWCGGQVEVMFERLHNRME